ncbi:hypothetical protein TWF281_007002 [Arthrobotrys megalospora]
MEKILSLPMELQLEILSYLDFESQIAASTVCENWATLLLSNHSTQLARRFTEPHGGTGLCGLPLLLDSGRRNWYIKTVCDYGTIYTYLFIKSKGPIWYIDDKGQKLIPNLATGTDISDCPLLDDLIFPPRELAIRQPPRTTISTTGTVTINKPVKRMKRTPLSPFFILRNPSDSTALGQSHLLQCPGIIDFREKVLKFSVYKRVRVGDFAQVGVDMLWELNRKGCLKKKDDSYQLFVMI